MEMKSGLPEPLQVPAASCVPSRRAEENGSFISAPARSRCTISRRMAEFSFREMIGGAVLPAPGLEMAKNVTSVGMIGPWLETSATTGKSWRLTNRARLERQPEPFIFAVWMVLPRCDWATVWRPPCPATANGFWPWFRVRAADATWLRFLQARENLAASPREMYKCTALISSPTAGEFWKRVAPLEAVG